MQSTPLDKYLAFLFFLKKIVLLLQARLQGKRFVCTRHCRIRGQDVRTELWEAVWCRVVMVGLVVGIGGRGEEGERAHNKKTR